MGAVVIQEDGFQFGHLLGPGLSPVAAMAWAIRERAPKPTIWRRVAGSIGGAAPGRQHRIGGAQQVGRGVHQGAVQVEDQGYGSCAGQ